MQIHICRKKKLAIYLSMDVHTLLDVSKFTYMCVALYIYIHTHIGLFPTISTCFRSKALFPLSTRIVIISVPHHACLFGFFSSTCSLCVYYLSSRPTKIYIFFKLIISFLLQDYMDNMPFPLYWWYV